MRNGDANLPHVAYLPIAQSGAHVAMDRHHRLVAAWIAMPEQQRVGMYIDQGVMDFAIWKANDIITNTLSPGHRASNGEYPNDSLRRMGVWIPEWWPVGGNQVEIIGYNPVSIAVCLEMWLDSPLHAKMLVGSDPFYREQIRAGGGWVINADRRPEEWASVFVLVSVPEMR